MKILVIFTGGTIGSKKSEKFISPNENQKYLLIEKYREMADEETDFETISPYYILSENLSNKELSLLSKTVLENLKKDFDGIIITHGTDTIQYSASAVSFSVGLQTIPIVFVSSNYVLEDDGANGLDNFSSAVNFIKEKRGNGVFVSYKNNGDDKTYIHRGTRLLAHSEYSDSLFSVENSFYGYFQNKKFFKNKNYFEVLDEVKPFENLSLKEKNGIVLLNSFPNESFNIDLKETKAVLIKSYHSGTLFVENKEFIRFAKDLCEKNIPLFLLGADKNIPYESTKEFDNLKIILLSKSSFISKYIKLWFIISNDLDFSLLDKSLSADIIK